MNRKRVLHKLLLAHTGLREGCGFVQVASRLRHLEYLPDQIHEEICELMDEVKSCLIYHFISFK